MAGHITRREFIGTASGTIGLGLTCGVPAITQSEQTEGYRMNRALKILRIHPRDNVVVALENLESGLTFPIDGLEIETREFIPQGHKVALFKISAQEQVIKYGLPIGHATSPIEPGMWVHVHNVQTNLSDLIEYKYEPDFQPVAPIDTKETFEGFIRRNGEVGIRNDLWIVPTVGCVNETAKTLAQKMRTVLPKGNISGVYAWPHTHGCSQLGGDLQRTQKILAGLVRHPNAGGVLVLSLGCESNTLDSFRNCLEETNPDRVKFLVCQQVADEMEAGIKLLHALLEYAGTFQRTAVSLNRLRVGLKCGGSDGFSGITANPLVGMISDRLVANGGTTVLTEVPEMFGAETLLMKRCMNRETFDQCVEMINDYKKYFIRYGQPVYENSSPGNKDGGLTTVEDKSAGCTQKGGTSPVVDVLPYGGLLRKSGLNLLAAPGNDMVATTALIASGCHLILFTTGRGTPFGGPVPTLKISTNRDLAKRKKNWIDFNAGQLLEGVSMQECADQLYRMVVDVASGRCLARNEENGVREIAIFKDGVTM